MRIVWARRAAEQVGLDRRFLGLERGDTDVAAEDSRGRVEQVIATLEKGLERGRQVEDEGRVGHVAEVDDRRDVAVGVEERVVDGQVVVDDLAAQASDAWLEPLAPAIEDPLHERPALRVGDEREVRGELVEVAEVPGDVPPGRGVEEPPQRPTEAGERLAEACQRLGRQTVRIAVATWQERDEPGEVGRTGRVADPRHVIAGEARSGRRHREVGVDTSDMEDRLDLHVDDRRILDRVGYLEDPGAAVGPVDPDVLVALAHELGRRARDAPRLSDDASCVLEAEARRLGHHHTAEARRNCADIGERVWPLVGSDAHPHRS